MQLGGASAAPAGTDDERPARVELSEAPQPPPVDHDAAKSRADALRAEYERARRDALAEMERRITDGLLDCEQPDRSSWRRDPKTVSILLCIALGVFMVAFGIGFASGQKYALRVKYINMPPGPPAPESPPAPWFDAPPSPPRPDWVTSAAPAFEEVRALKMPVGHSTPSWDSITFDPFFKICWLALDGDGFAYVDMKHSFFYQLIWLPDLRGNHITMVSDGQAWVSSVPDQAAILINAWTSLGVEMKRVPLGAGARASAFDSGSNRMAFALTNGSVAVLDSPSGQLRGCVMLRPPTASFSDHALQSPRMGNGGFLYVAMPYDNKVAKVDMRSTPPKLVSLWDTRPCVLPTGMDIDLRNNRIFVGCADATQPMLAVLDLADGYMVTHVPIGRGNGAVVYDAGQQRVYASNGVAGNVAVIQQDPADPDQYALLEAATTYVGASRLAYDAATQTLWTASAQGSYDPTLGINPDSGGVQFFPNYFFPNTIKLVALQPAGVTRR